MVRKKVIAERQLLSSSREEKSNKNHVRLEDVLECIFSYLPQKTLYKLKCVSKGWYRLITDLSRIPPRATDAGFLVLQHSYSSSTTNWKFFRASENGGVVITKSLTFKPGKSPWILDSCRGLILCNMPMGHNRTYFCVCNPSSSEWVAIPQPPPRGQKMWDGYGLAVNEPHFKVIHFLSDKRGVTNMKLEIFSSETGQWKEQRVVILTSCPGPARIFGPKPSTLYMNGSLHWIWDGSVLIYHLNYEYFKFIELPRTSSTAVTEGSFARCLWESEGRLHYCRGGYDRIQIWVLTRDGHFTCNGERSLWTIKHSVEIRTLKLQNPEIFLQMEQRRIPQPLLYFESFAFNDNFQIVYIRVCQTFLSYNLKNGMLKEILFPPFAKELYYDMYPFEHGMVNLAVNEALKMERTLVPKQN